MKTLLMAASDLVTVAGCAAALWHLSNGKPIAALAAIAVAWVARRINV